MAAKKTAAKKKPAPRLHKERKSESGTVIHNGTIYTDEYNTNLVGQQAVLTYDKMLRSNATVQENIDLLTLPIRSAKWSIQRASESERDTEVADFVYAAIFENMNITWDAFLEAALEALPYGFSLFEVVYKDIMWNGKKQLGVDLFSIYQKTVFRWVKQDGEPGITQSVESGFTTSVDWDDLLRFTFRQRGDDYQGRSILRAAYPHWYYVNNFYKIQSIGLERTHVGVPIVSYPQSAGDTEKALAESIAKNIRANEHAFASLPTGYTVEMLDMKSNTGRDIQPAIDHHILQIAHATLTAFAHSGSTPNGSRATSQDLSSMFEHALESVGNQLKSIIQQLIRKLVDLNFVDVKEYPSIQYSGIKRDDLENLALNLQRLMQAKLLTYDPKLEAYLRNKYGLPEIDASAAGKPVVNDNRKAEMQTEKDQKAKDQAKASEKTVAVHRMPGETMDDCVSRAIPLLVKEGMDKDQAAGAAYSMCKMPKKSSASEKQAGQQYWRPLTAAEKKVDFDNLEAKINRAENQMRERLMEINTSQREFILDQVRRALLSDNPTQQVQNLSVLLKDKYGETLFDEMRTIFEYSKITTADEMAVGAPKTSQDQTDFMHSQANSIADKHANDLAFAAQSALNTAITTKRPFQEAVDLISQVMQDKSTQQIEDTVHVSVIGTINDGRTYTQQQHTDKIYAYEYSAILDSSTCAFCMALDGKVVAKTDPAYFRLRPPQHFSCRCIWVEILVDETDKPAITGIPEQINQDMTVTNFKQLTKKQQNDIENQ